MVKLSGVYISFINVYIQLLIQTFIHRMSYDAFNSTLHECIRLHVQAFIVVAVVSAKWSLYIGEIMFI